MNHPLLHQCIKSFGPGIEELDVGGKGKLCVLSEAGHEEDKRAANIEIIGKKRIGLITKRMLENQKFRDFMLVNLQNIFQHLRGGPKYKCVIGRQDEKKDDLYEIIVKDHIGFVAEKLPESATEWSTPQMIDFITDFTDQFKRDISYLRFGNPKTIERIDTKTDLIDQVAELKRVCEFKSDTIVLTDKVALIKESFNNQKSRAFFSAWQLNIFFEQYIGKFIEEKLPITCHINKQLAVLPTKGTGRDIDGNDVEYKNGFLEIDIIGYNTKNDELILVECKNGELREAEINKFIGRTKIIEATYGIKIDKKIMIGTKYLDRFFKPLPRETAILDLRWFDNRSYRDNCYQDFIEYLGN